MATAQRVHLVRHGETEWSLSGRHTGVTDIPLTEKGRRDAAFWKPVLARERFALVLTSPMRRARETCELVGLGAQSDVDPDLMEWNYGDYEGLTPQEIHAQRPEWIIFSDGGPGGENPRQVQDRIDRIISKIHAATGHVALFSHGHFLRAFAARWIGLCASDGGRFLLDTAAWSVLSSYDGIPAVMRWNVLSFSEVE